MKKCRNCGKSTEQFSRCRICLDRANFLRKKRSQEWLIEDSCPKCGKQPMNNSKYCLQCVARARKENRKVRSTRLNMGLCSSCGKNKLTGDQNTCLSCLGKLRKLSNARACRLGRLGLCVRCGLFPQLYGITKYGKSYTICQTCHLKHTSQSHLGTRGYADALLSKLKAQNYKCPYTDDDLTLGVNAWIDHIMPKVRFPELAKNIDNLEWVTRDVNRAKQDKTPDEFLILIEKIYTKRLCRL